MKAYRPGAVYVDDGGEFGNDFCTRIATQSEHPYRVAVASAPDRPGVETLAIVPDGELSLAAVLEAAVEHRIPTVVAPRYLDDPLTLITEAATACGSLLNKDVPGLAVLFSHPGAEFTKIATVADLEDPVQTGILAWMAVNVAWRLGADLDILVVGATGENPPKNMQEALNRFKLRSGEALVRASMEVAENNNLVINWIPLGRTGRKSDRILQAITNGGYDLVLDDIPEINIGPRLGRRRRVRKAVSSPGSTATGYRLLQDSPCDVGLVLDAVRMGLIPGELARAGAAAVMALGMAGAVKTVVDTSPEEPVSVEQTMDGAVDETGEAATGDDVEAAAPEGEAPAEVAPEGEAPAEEAPAGDQDKTEEVVAAATEGLPSVDQATVEDLQEAEQRDQQLTAEKEQLTQQLDAKKDYRADVENFQESTADDLAQAEADAEQAAAEAAEYEAAAKEASGAGLFNSGSDETEALISEIKAEEAAAAATAAELQAEQLEAQSADLDAKHDQVNQEIQQLGSERQSVATAQQEVSATAESYAEVVDQKVTPTENFEYTSTYNESGPHWSSGFHTGTDYAAPEGTPIYAAADGVVVEAGWGGAYGNYTVIQHEDGTTTHYAHQSSQSVSVGDTVSAGEQIGTVGSTGNSTGAHLHFEVRDSAGNFMDPIAWLGS